MIRIALKNLWSQRKVYGWLALELVILSILAWVIIDPTVVRIYYAHQPLGYDSDRLVEVTIDSYPSTSSKYSAEAADSTSISNNFDRVYNTISKFPGVESATIVSYEIEGSSSWNGGLYTETDTVSASGNKYLQGTPFLATYGIKPTDGQSVEQMQLQGYSPDDIIISESTARWLGKKPKEILGLTVGDYSGEKRIVGVTNDVRPKSVSPNNTNMFLSATKEDIGMNYFLVVIRLKDGIDPAKFVDDNRQALNEKLSIGNYHPTDIRTYAEKSAELQYTQGYTNANRIGIFMAIFYLVNMALGVIGTVWLQTRRRSGEAGVMKAFGARPRHIVTTLIWEGVILTTITWMLGSLIYMQYALRKGLATARYFSNWYFPESWVNDFWTHFSIVALIILALMLIAVVIGIWIPARRIARVDPAIALKDE